MGDLKLLMGKPIVEGQGIENTGEKQGPGHEGPQDELFTLKAMVVTEGSRQGSGMVRLAF